MARLKPPTERTRAEVSGRGEGIGLSVLDWAAAVLFNGSAIVVSLDDLLGLTSLEMIEHHATIRREER